jgi:two-component system cell cycle response regulator DivK
MARLLLIEDNPANMELLRFILEAFGHTTLCASDGRAGLELARKEHPDLVLCDLRMPLLDGFGVLREIRADERLQGMVMVAVTAYSMPGDRDDALKAGFDGYITKPITPQTIVQEVEALLATGRPESP